MNLYWHIAKKDFRRLWPLLVAWWVVIILRALEPALDFSGGGRSMLRFYFNFFYSYDRPTVLLWADFILLVLIGVAAIRCDSPIKPFAQWRTLPLSGAQVLRSKMLFIAVFCGAAAALVDIAAKIGYKLPLAEYLDGLGWIEWKVALCVALGAALGSLFRHPFFTPMVWVILYGCGAILFEFPAIWFIKLGGGSQSLNGALFITRFLFWINLLAVAVVGAVVWVYLTRKRVWSWVMLGGGFAVAQAAQAYWPLELVTAFGREGSPMLMLSRADVPGFSLQFSPLQLFISTSGFSFDDHLSCVLQGSATMTAPHSREPSETWIYNGGRWAFPAIGGQSLHSSPGANTWPVNYAEVLQSLGLGKLRAVPFELKLSGQWLSEDPKNFLEPEGQTKTPRRLQGEVQFCVGQMERIEDIPAKAEARFSRGRDNFSILSMRGTSEGDWLNLEDRHKLGGMKPIAVQMRLLCQSVDTAGLPFSALMPRYQDWYSFDGRSYSSRTYYFVLWNPKRQEVVPADRNISMGRGLSDALAAKRNDNLLYFDFTDLHDGATLTPQDMMDWLADARLVKLQFVPKYLYLVQVNVDNISFPTHATPYVDDNSNP